MIRSIKKHTTLYFVIFSAVCISLFLAAFNVYMDDITDDLIIYEDYEFVRLSEQQNISLITVRLNSDIDAGENICINTYYQEMQVYENGTLIYKYEKEFHDIFGKSPANRWHIIPFSNTSGNKVFEFILQSPYDNIDDFKNTVLIGKSIKLIEYINVRSVPAVLISLLSVFVGLITFVRGMVDNNKNIYKRLTLLGIILTLLGVWSFGESRRIFFNVIPPHIEHQMNLYALILTPIFFFLIVSEYYEGLSNKILKIIAAISAINAFVVLLLQLFMVVDFLETLGSLVIITVLGLAITIVLKINKIVKQKSQDGKRYTFHLFFITLFVALEIISFSNGRYNDTGNYIRIVLSIAILMAFFIYFTDNIKKSQQIETINENLEVIRNNLISVKMKPHLISNTLLSIQELCYNDSVKAVEAINVFAKYLRSSFDISSYENLVSFETELEYIREYMEVEKICYGDEIRYIEDIGINSFYVPPLTLQPLVENAIKHGIRKRAGLGTVTLRTYKKNNYIYVEIIDDGVGFEISKTRLGFYDNTYKTKTIAGASSGRNLQLLLENLIDATIKIKSKKGKGTKVTVKIPC